MSKHIIYEYEVEYIGFVFYSCFHVNALVERADAFFLRINDASLKIVNGQ